MRNGTQKSAESSACWLCSTSGRPVVKGRQRDRVVKFLSKLSEVQSVEDQQSSNVSPMS